MSSLNIDPGQRAAVGTERGTGTIKVIYSCYGGTHSSPIAAAIHLGMLPSDRVPEARRLMDIPRFDRVGPREYGQAELVGTDAAGNEVYVLGRGPAASAVQHALWSGLAIGGGDRSRILFVDTLDCVNGLMRVGGFLSRRIGWVSVGRPTVLWGTRRAYPRLAALVHDTKRRLNPAAVAPGLEENDHPKPK